MRMHTVCFMSMCTYINQTSNEVHKSQMTWSALVLGALSHDAVLCTCSLLLYVCVVLCCIAEGGSESPETSSEFLSRVSPSILELPDPTHSLSALPEGRNS
jgi:hypothetical protein